MTEKLRYRFARPDEIPSIGQLVSHSFPGPNRSPALWQEQLRDPVYGGGPQTLVVGKDAGRTVAALQIYPLRQWIGGTLLPVSGVGMVAVSPTHRKRGIAADLMTHALRASRERGDAGSALYPFRVSFYQKLGYGQAGYVVQHLITPADLPDSPERMRVELLDTEALKNEAFELYGRWAPTQNGQFERTERMWAELLSPADRGLVGCRSASGQLEGYALVAYRADLPRTNRYLEVDEMLWVSEPARRGLHGWLSSMADQWEQILVRSLSAHGLDNLLREPRLPPTSAPGWRLYAPAATLMAGPMFRLVNVQAAWEQRRVAQADPFAINIHVTDQQIPENDGSWRLAFHAGQVTVDKKNGVAGSIRLNVSTLSRLYIGALTPRAALEAGLLECDQPDLIDPLGRVLALPEPWSFDRF